MNTMNTMNTPSSGVRCNGEKVRQLRATHGMTQEKLSVMSGVDKRTIQRAEKSEPLRIDTIANLASALKVTVNDITNDSNNVLNDVTADNDLQERNTVVLKRTLSGKTLLDIICDSFSGTVLCSAEPTRENIDALSAIVERLESLIPDPWQPPHETHTFTLAERLRAAVELSEQLESLEKSQITVYAGTYTASAQIPSYDMDEGFMSVNMYQKYKPVTVCRVVLDRLGLDRVVVKVNDQWIEPAPVPAPPPASSKFEADDEIPF